MSTGSTPTESAVPARPLAPHEVTPPQVRIISHCTLFYWWPVWAIGFIMAFVTYFDSQRMVLVDFKNATSTTIEVKVDGKAETHPAWTLPERTVPVDSMIRVSRAKSLGVLFSIVLLLVIAITNVPLRGMWSVIVLILIVSLSIIFALLHWWDNILNALRILDIRINFEGYLLISTVLFVLWLVVFFFFDNQIYMVFTPTQFRVRQEIGDAETVYDTTGLQIEKQRSDLFRHWILGLGSGDLVVRTAGASTHHFEMANVLFVGRKVEQIEKVLRLQSTKKDS